MDFTDRDGEIARLDRLRMRSGGGLAVVWGRRRIGKTRLLVEWVRRAGGIYFVADESSPPMQRRRLASAVAERLPDFDRVEYPDWGSLLDRLARDAKRGGVRGPVVIDELPYLVAASPDLPSTLQRFIDHGAREARLVVALAGSSQRMMQGLVLDASAPLYGRAHEAFAVTPLAPAHLGRALSLRDPVSILRSYGVWGGVPRYWELAEPFDDVRGAVDALVLDPGGALHDEPAHLLREEVPPAIALRPLLDAIGSGAHRVSEIGGRIGAPATALVRPLARLVELGLVVRDSPFGEPPRTSKRSLYRLADPFLRLWFSLVAPKRALLTHAPRKVRLALFDARAPHLWAAAWEELCRAAVPHLGEVLGAQHGPAQRLWGGGGPEWDVVAAGTERDDLLLGEVKWSSDPMTDSDLVHAFGALAKKGVPRLPHGRVVYALFVPLAPRKRPRGLPPDARIVDAAAVLAATAGDG